MDLRHYGTWRKQHKLWISVTEDLGEGSEAELSVPVQERKAVNN